MPNLNRVSAKCSITNVHCNQADILKCDMSKMRLVLFLTRARHFMQLHILQRKSPCLPSNLFFCIFCQATKVQ